jgi:DNA-binding GntR family transcriptional regulator
VAPSRVALNASSLSEQIASHLQQRIFAGAYGPGDRLSEVAVADLFGVSRGPAREALRQLADRGLVVQEPRKSAYVPTVDVDEFRYLSEVREALETTAAGLAALRATEADVERLRDVLAETGGLIDGPAGGPYPSQLDIHGGIAAAAHNPVLAGEIDQINTRLRLVRVLSGRSHVRAAAALAEHGEIVAAVARGDSEDAARLMSAHLRTASRHSAAVLRGRLPVSGTP